MFTWSKNGRVSFFSKASIIFRDILNSVSFSFELGFRSINEMKLFKEFYFGFQYYFIYFLASVI